jgi:lactate 2-monooxygenase
MQVSDGPIEEPSIAAGEQRQVEIYGAAVRGEAGTAIPVDAERLREAARAAIPAHAFTYADSSAGAGATTAANRRALDHWAIVPRMLRNVAVRDTGLTLFGRAFASPLFVGPIGGLELADGHADLAVARACAAEGVPMILSCQASYPMEQVARELGDTPRWFQLYWSKSDALVESLVRRAEACGCEAIVVTVDTPLLGWRTGDLDLGFLPFLRGQGLAQYVSDPVFRAMLDRPPEQDMQAALRHFLSIYSNPALSWEKLAFLRGVTKLPILLKGILHPQDAEIAAAHGVDGIIVSNHGGRQVDGAIGAADALPAIVRALDGAMPILFDSGIRGGADIVKVLALGAQAALLARPVFYALAVAGEQGVAELLRNMRAELDLTLALAGVTRLSEIDAGLIVRAGD